MNVSGKMVCDYFFPPFSEVLALRGIKIDRYEKHRDFLARLSEYRNPVVVIVFNEEHYHQVYGPDPTRENVFEIESRLATVPHLQLHSHWHALVCGNKHATGRLMSEAGVPVPALMERATASVFSTVPVGSGRQVDELAAGSTLNPDRYNVEFVDTRIPFRDKTYYVSLRAMAFGSHLTAIYPRARDTAENNPSVHAGDTPVDPELMGMLYERLIVPRRQAIADMVRRAGDALGLGFYAHDLLPADDGRTLLCETNVKFEEHSLRNRLSPIRDRLPFAELLCGGDTRIAAKFFLMECQARGYLLDSAPEEAPDAARRVA